MELEEQYKDITLEQIVSREQIMETERVISETEGSFKGDSDHCPLTHHFSDGMYTREIFIPKGMVVVGKIHKHDHPNFLLSGKVLVVTEEGREVIEGPKTMISKPGTKRALVALEDLTWVTVHLNLSNTTDLKILEKEIIAPSYEAYDKFIDSKKKPLSKLRNFIIKKLSV